VRSALAAAVGASGSFAVRAQDPATGYFSSPSPATSNVTLSAAPVTVTRPAPLPAHASLATFVITMAAPVTFETYDAQGNDRGPVSLATFAVPLASVEAQGAPVFRASSVIAQAVWNAQMLRDDGTKGVHNPPFYDAVIDATSARLTAMP
jgi:hypothetical protein